LEAVNTACGEIYPDFSFLANCFNNELISSVAGDLSARAKAHGVNLLFTPEGRTKSNPYTTGLSEDPFYTGAVIFNVAKTVKSLGAVPCITGFALTECDADYLDVFPDARAIREYLFRPLDRFAGSAGNVFMTSFTRLSGRYEKINSENLSAYLHEVAGESGFVICSQTDSDLTVESVAAGNLFSYSGDLGALGAAVANYNSLKSAVERGEATREELEAACRSGSALSPLTVDVAADKVVDFALYCNSGADGGNAEKIYDTAAISLQAAEESCVLLKNDGVLPLRGSERVGVIGQPAYLPNGATRQNFLQTLATKPPFTFVGAAQGYTLADDRNDSLLAEAVSLAKKCDTVLLFLGLDKQKEERLSIERRLKLPANRLALISALRQSGVKIIAVITTSKSVDVSFDKEVSALICAPVSCMRGGEALINILCGKSPSGRLANTVYGDTDEYFEKIKRDKDSGKIRVGTFIGYRYYSTAHLSVNYPFGHGQSYSAFGYSNLTVQGEQILVTLKNTGSREAGEVVQLYVGKPDSKIIRPEKELKSYIKVNLTPGESKTLCFRLSPERLAVYCPETGKNVTEGGSYNIYVGSSVNDIKLTGKIEISGSALKPDNARRSDFIPTLSNVVDGGYTLSPVQRVASDGKKLRLAGLILMLLAVLGATVYAILNLAGVISFGSDDGLPAVLALIIIVFIAAVALLIVSAVQIKKAKAHPVAVSVSRPEAVKVEGSDSLDSLFEQEFDGEEEEQEEKQELSDDGQEILKYLDDTLTFACAAENLRVFCAERGLTVNIGTARKILSAFVSSRLILIKSSLSHGEKLMRLLCEFFGVVPAVEKYEKCASSEELLNLGEGSILNAIHSAEAQKHYVRPVCVDGADIGDIGSFASAFAKYIRNPEMSCTVGIDGGDITLEKNLWFVFTLSENSFLKDADALVAETACIIEAELAYSSEKEIKTELNTLSYHQLKKLSEAVKREYSLDEDKCWKKVDKLEKFVRSHTPYEIGNKEWQAIERFVSAYLACGGGELDALDNVVASKLMITACTLLNGKLGPSDGSVLSAVEKFFGEENIAETKKLLAYSGLTAAGRRNNARK
ncbi:MAG: glycoside hydrolase family 3 C-terminal domain-containing protein, partial [Clostridia bacterium]|nr:glycoside hydrolase family 3 C-terminal domain-containing protein [Clostridia bacterium]